MEARTLILVAIAGAAVWGLLELWIRRRASRKASRNLDRVLHSGLRDPMQRAPLEPENRFVVRVSDDEIVCERPDGNVERAGWADLRRVEVITTGDGPFAPDVFWVLHGTEGGCAVPQGATGDRELLARLQALPGFDNEAVIEAMGSTSDARFVCWERV